MLQYASVIIVSIVELTRNTAFITVCIFCSYPRFAVIIRCNYVSLPLSSSPLLHRTNALAAADDDTDDDDDEVKGEQSALDPKTPTAANNAGQKQAGT